MSVTTTIKITDAHSARSALLAKYGTIKAAARAMTKKYGFIDYERLLDTLKGTRNHKQSIEQLCKELGVKPEIFEGAAK